MKSMNSSHSGRGFREWLAEPDGCLPTPSTNRGEKLQDTGNHLMRCRVYCEVQKPYSSWVYERFMKVKFGVNGPRESFFIAAPDAAIVQKYTRW